MKAKISWSGGATVEELTGERYHFFVPPRRPALPDEALEKGPELVAASARQQGGPERGVLWVREPPVLILSPGQRDSPHSPHAAASARLLLAQVQHELAHHREEELALACTDIHDGRVRFR